MKETNQVDDQNALVDDSAEDSAKDLIDYKKYSKAMDKLKSRERENAEIVKNKQDLEEKLKLYEQKELESKGEQSKVIEALREEIKITKEKLDERHKNYAWSVMSAQIKEHALRNSCVDPDALLKLMDKEELSKIQVDQSNYQVNFDDTERVISNMRNKYNYLFKSQAKAPADMVPSNINKPKTTIKELDSKQIEILLKENFGKK